MKKSYLRMCSDLLLYEKSQPELLAKLDCLIMSLLFCPWAKISHEGPIAPPPSSAFLLQNTLVVRIRARSLEPSILDGYHYLSIAIVIKLIVGNSVTTVWQGIDDGCSSCLQKFIHGLIPVLLRNSLSFPYRPCFSDGPKEGRKQ